MKNLEVNKITSEKLKELENKPKTKTEKFFDKLILFLPTLVLVLSLLEYYFVPNFKDYYITDVYGIFLAIQLFIFFILSFLSLFVKKLYYKIRHIAPLATFIYLLLMLYDYSTLKTNKLVLPYFPWVDNILNAMIEDREYLLVCIKHSLKLLFTGYFYGVFTGLITGIACGYSKTINYWVSPFMKLLGAIPSITWIPVIMILASSLFAGAVIVIGLGVWYSVTMASFAGIKNIDRSYYEAAKTLGAKEYQLIFKIAIPSALPHIFQGLIVGMSTACVSLLAAEMIGVEAGLGWYIAWQRGWAKFSNMYGAIIIICIIFVIVNYALGYIKKKVLRWQEGVI